MYQVSYNVYVETEGCKYVDEFNPAFIQAWKTTSNYAKWLERPHPAVLELHPGHMFSGQLSMSDVKLKITQITQYASDFHRFLWKRLTNLLLFFFLTRTMQNTEKGRKISNAAASTSRAVAQTSKAVGKLFHSLRSLFTQCLKSELVHCKRRRSFIASERSPFQLVEHIPATAGRSSRGSR